jgi:hypothetical protein
MVNLIRIILPVFLYQALAHLAKHLSMEFALLVLLATFALVDRLMASLNRIYQSCAAPAKYPMQAQLRVFGIQQPFVQLERTLIHQLPIMQRIVHLVQQIVLV